LATDQLPEDEQARPQALIMLTGLYLFLLLVSIGSYGQPIALFGLMLEDTAARIFIAANSLCCLYLFLGLWQRQLLTWYLLLSYNLFEIVNTLGDPGVASSPGAGTGARGTGGSALAGDHQPGHGSGHRLGQPPDLSTTGAVHQPFTLPVFQRLRSFACIVFLADSWPSSLC